MTARKRKPRLSIRPKPDIVDRLVGERRRTPPGVREQARDLLRILLSSSSEAR
jgi:hypothetical protein